MHTLLLLTVTFRYVVLLKRIESDCMKMPLPPKQEPFISTSVLRTYVIVFQRGKKCCMGKALRTENKYFHFALNSFISRFSLHIF